MITIPELASEALGSHLAAQMGRRYGSTDAELVEIVQSAARLAIDCGAALMSAWVISRHSQCKKAFPLYPRKRTFLSAV